MAEYSTLQDSWRDQHYIRWMSPAGQFIGEFPISYLETCGLDPWTYMLDVLTLIVDGERDRTVVTRIDGSTPVFQSPLVQGTYIYRTDGALPRAPLFKRADMQSIKKMSVSPEDLNISAKILLRIWKPANLVDLGQRVARLSLK